MSAAPHRDALDDRFSLIYEELRRLAGNVLRNEVTPRMTPTTLLHEAWLKLAGFPQLADTTPVHFRRIAARAMRQVLVEAARRREALSRKQEQFAVTFDESLPGLAVGSCARDLLALDGALERLYRISERQARIVEGRFFGGLEVAELANALNVSEATVAREWRSARAWLAMEIRRDLAGHPFHS
jgi:RNA polymerase sigma factor (TIGR02999 family)